jgi:hypothetical protein
MKRSKIIEISLMILATALIMLGVAVCTAGISIHIVYLYDRYQGFAENGYFDSFLHYYCAVGKGNLVASILIGAIPASTGILLFRWKWESIW